MVREAEKLAVEIITPPAALTAPRSPDRYTFIGLTLLHDVAGQLIARITEPWLEMRVDTGRITFCYGDHHFTSLFLEEQLRMTWRTQEGRIAVANFATRSDSGVYVSEQPYKALVTQIVQKIDELCVMFEKWEQQKK